MPKPKPRTNKWTPFDPGKKAKTYTPKAGETKAKQNLRAYKDILGKKRGRS